MGGIIGKATLSPKIDDAESNTKWDESFRSYAIRMLGGVGLGWFCRLSRARGTASPQGALPSIS
jgi:hypothetical protein